MSLAPIILFVYNRPWHTRETLVALMQNELAGESELYVFADGTTANDSEENLKKIEETRKVLEEKSWCGKVHIHLRSSNMGLAASVIDGITQVINKHGKIIVLEDDLVTSPHFLTFCNEGLTKYENKKNIYAINAFQFPIETELAQTFLSPLSTSSWGWATWQDRWEQFEEEPNNIILLNENKHLKRRFNLADYNFVGMLSNKKSWAIRWYYTAFTRNGLGVFPTKSLVYNIGFDNSGVHCGPVTFKQNIYKEKMVVRLESKVNLELYAKVLDFFTKESPKRNTKPKSKFRRLISLFRVLIFNK